MSWQDLPGFFDFGWLYADWAVAAPESARFVEVGVYAGRSLAFMADALAERPDVEIWGVDVWGLEYGLTFGDFAMRLRSTSPTTLDRANLLRCPSVRAARIFDDRSLDFVFIDADHSYEAVRADIAAWLPKVRQGGTLAGHDCSEADYPGVVRAVREAFGGDFTQPGPGSSWVVKV